MTGLGVVGTKSRKERDAGGKRAEEEEDRKQRSPLELVGPQHRLN